MNVNTLFAVTIALSAGLSTAASAQDLQLQQAKPLSAAPSSHFTGSVKVGNMFESVEHQDYKGALVEFSAGAYTDWHTHPRGQTLVVTRGEGRVQTEGNEARAIKPGDQVWIPANVRHWHGAAKSKSMTHIAIQAPDEDGKVVTWMEKVDSDIYHQANQ